jgi:hypothetical protein
MLPESTSFTSRSESGRPWTGRRRLDPNGGANETLARRRGMAATDRREYRALAVERYRRSHEIWADLQARGLVSPVDTGLVSASARNLADAGRLVVAADSTIVLQEAE